MALPKLNTPVYELTVPSTGKKITYRPFLVKEHKILMTLTDADDSETARVVKELVRVCTFEKVDPDKLAHFDIEYIFMMLRSKSIGEMVDVIVTCDCGNKIDTSFSIEDLEIEKNPEHTNKIKINDTVGMEMNYPSFDNVIEIYESEDTNRIVDLICKCIKSIYDNENYWDSKDLSKEELQEFLLSLTRKQLESIEEFFITAPKVVQKINATCPVCGKGNHSRLEGLRNFFV